MQSILLKLLNVRIVFTLLTLLLAVGCQTTTSDVSPPLHVKLAADEDFNSLVSGVSKVTTMYYKHLTSLSAPERQKTSQRINQLSRPGKTSESVLIELSQLMGYSSMVKYKAAISEIESSKGRLLEVFPELADGSHLAEFQTAAAMSHNAAIANGGTAILLREPGNCTGIYRACTAVVAVGVVAACGPAAPFCVGIAVAGAAAGMELCHQEQIGCQSTNGVKYE